MNFVRKFFLVLSMAAFLGPFASADETFNKLSKSHQKAIAQAINDYMTPYSQAVSKASVLATRVLLQCVRPFTDYNEFPWELFNTVKDSPCYGRKDLERFFTEVWTDLDPGLPNTEFDRWREYQTIAQMGHEAQGATNLMHLSARILGPHAEEENYRELGSYLKQDDFGGEDGVDLTFEVSQKYFQRGDGCFLVLEYKKRSREARLVEYCD